MQRRITRIALATVATVGIAALAACSSTFGSSSGGSTPTSASGLTSSDKPLSVLIGSSGTPETNAVKKAVAAWSKTSGTSASVQAASNLDQQLAQGFSSGQPADVFYLSTTALAGYADNGSLLAYGGLLKNTSDFYPSLTKNFTYKGQLYCAPKDFSTLQLMINTTMWKQAGLTAADYPTTWAQLKSDAKKLTTADHVGLVVAPQYERLGVFMAEAGGNLMNASSTKATADSAANVTALNYVKSMLSGGEMKFSTDLGTGSGGESFGKKQAAMTIEGPWMTSSMSADYPSVDYTYVELPAGPAGKGTLQFTNCWGIAADSPNQKAALALVEKLTSTSDQLAFSKAFGVIPSVQSAAAAWKKQNPALVPFLDGASYAEGVPTAAGSADVVTDIDSKLSSLAKTDPKTLLAAEQKNLQAILK